MILLTPLRRPPVTPSPISRSRLANVQLLLWSLLPSHNLRFLSLFFSLHMKALIYHPMPAVEFALHLTLLDLVRRCHRARDLIFLITAVDSISLLISEVIPLWVFCSAEHDGLRTRLGCPFVSLDGKCLSSQAVHVETYQVWNREY